VVVHFEQAKISRLIDLVKFIQGNQSGTAKKLAQRFSISEKTVYEDLRELNAVGIPVYFSSLGLRILPAFSPAWFHFSSEESLLLSMGLAVLYKNGMVEEEKLNALREKIALPGEDIPEEDFSRIADRSKGPVANVIRPGVMAVIHEAVLRKQYVCMRYRSLNQIEASERDLSPYTVV
jgi:predicted DNA-binding transcriptional regulator YafY